MSEYVANLQSAIEFVTKHGSQFGADTPGMILHHIQRRFEAELRQYLTGKES